MSVYILHFDEPLAHARYYVGWANDVPARLAHHRAGIGARLCQVLNEHGIAYELARVFDGQDKTSERKLKNTKHTPRYCPICSSEPRDYHPKEALSNPS